MSPRVPENKVMVIYGRKMAPGSRVGFVVITKGGRSPIPIIETYEMMDIGPQNVELDHRDIKVLAEGVDRKASMRATATVLVLDDEAGLHTAVQHLLHINHSDIGMMARRFIEARFRTTLRNMDIKEATSDLMKTANDIQARIQKDMFAIGVTVGNLTLHELKLRGE